MTNVSPSSTPASPSPSASSGAPTVTRQVTFSLRAFDHLKQTQRKLKAEQGLNLNNNQVLALIFGQHAEHYPAVGDESSLAKGDHHAQQ